MAVSNLRVLVGICAAPLVVPLLAIPLLIVAVAVPIVILITQVTLGGGLRGLFQTTPSIWLLEAVPEIGLAAGICWTFVRHPITVWSKVGRELLGFRLGQTPPLMAGSSSSSSGSSSGSSSSSIAALEVLEMKDGAKLVVRLRGHDAAAPAVLVLHGGPGASEMLAGQDGGLREKYLEKDFVVVDFDQRSAMLSGALNFPGGKFVPAVGSSKIPPAGLTVHQHVRDTVAVAEWLHAHPVLEAARASIAASEGNKPRPRLRLHLLGGSWGSFLALRVAAARPDLFESPIVVRGLVTDQLKSEALSVQYICDAMERCGKKQGEDRKMKAEIQLLRSFGDPPGSFRYCGSVASVNQMIRQRLYLDAWGGMDYATFASVHAETGARPKPKWRLFFDKACKALKTLKSRRSEVSAFSI